MKKTKRGVPASSRLPLSREVVRLLGASDIGQVAGGSDPHQTCDAGATCVPGFGGGGGGGGGTLQ